jgi:hypothetical protein
MRRAAVCAAAIAAMMVQCAPQARAGTTGFGLRIGPVNYNRGVGGATAYGVNVRLPVPFLEIAGSVEYSGKSNVPYEPDCNLQSGCPIGVYDLRDLAARATLGVPIFSVPNLMRIYIGGGLGQHMIRQPDLSRQYDTSGTTPFEYDTKTVNKGSYHAVAGGHVGIPMTHIGAFAEGRVSWIQTEPVLRQTALFVGFSLSLGSVGGAHP